MAVPDLVLPKPENDVYILVKKIEYHPRRDNKCTKEI
jgi:hypothetical protein